MQSSMEITSYRLFSRSRISACSALDSVDLPLLEGPLSRITRGFLYRASHSRMMAFICSGL